MDRVQATMAVVEGYAEHVMDAIAATALPEHEKLRAAMQKRRRSRSAPERLLQRLLGLEMKMRQYEEGKGFCDAVVTSRDIATLNLVWSSPEALPTSAELHAPEDWIARVDSLPAAA
jgi:putative hydrolase